MRIVLTSNIAGVEWTKEVNLPFVPAVGTRIETLRGKELAEVRAVEIGLPLEHDERLPGRTLLDPRPATVTLRLYQPWIGDVESPMFRGTIEDLLVVTGWNHE